MTNIKPSAYLINHPMHCGDVRTVKRMKADGVSESDILEAYPNSTTPLYAIPEGYHIVAIDHDQELLDNIAQHNEKVKANAKTD